MSLTPAVSSTSGSTAACAAGALEDGTDWDHLALEVPPARRFWLRCRGELTRAGVPAAARQRA